MALFYNPVADTPDLFSMQVMMIMNDNNSLVMISEGAAVALCKMARI